MWTAGVFESVRGLCSERDFVMSILGDLVRGMFAGSYEGGIVLQRERNRGRLRRVLRILGLPDGGEDDEHMCDEECGVHIGATGWVLCFGELGCGKPDGVFILDDKESDFVLCSGLPSATRIVKEFRRVADREGLWKRLR